MRANGRVDRHDAASSRFSQFCERTPKTVKDTILRQFHYSLVLRTQPEDGNTRPSATSVHVDHTMRHCIPYYTNLQTPYGTALCFNGIPTPRSLATGFHVSSVSYEYSP